MFHVKHRIEKLMKLAIWTSVAMYLANKFVESSATIHHLLKVKKDGFYDWRHGKVYYTKAGSGLPLLLIHDLSPASSQQEWTKVFDSLSENHTVYAIDLLGCGRSDKPNISYSNYLYVQLLTDFIQNVIKEKADIYATGKSGSFVIMAAKLNSNIIRDITLVNPESFHDSSVQTDFRKKFIKTLLDLPLLGTFLYYQLMSKNQLDYIFTEKYFYNPFHLDDRTILTYYEAAHLSHGDGRHLLASLYANYVNIDIQFALPKVENSIHLILGSEHPDARNITRSYQKIHPHTTCKFVDKAKMLPQLEAPEYFLNAIVSK